MGASLWAAQRILETDSTLAFPKYYSEANFNANSVSVALNKWLKPQVPDGCVIHSFRHSLRDRLRAIECPADIINAIGGWVTEGVDINMAKDTDLPSCMGGWRGSRGIAIWRPCCMMITSQLMKRFGFNHNEGVLEWHSLDQY